MLLFQDGQEEPIRSEFIIKYSNQSIYQKWWVLFLYKFLT
nr:MAG TPA: hypothetical protein [Caudoviricetes sp.]